MKPLLRIAHFTMGRCNPEAANGVDRAVAGLGQAQARLGHTVAVFSSTNKPPLPIPGVEVYCCPRSAGVPAWLTMLPAVRRHFALPDTLLSRLLAWRPDIVHLHSVHIPENIALGRALDRYGIPYGVTIHGGLTARIRHHHRWRKHVLKVLAEQRHLESAAFLHGISVHDLEGARDYGVAGSVSVVANGFDVGCIPEATDSSRLTSLHPEVCGRRVFMFLGRLDAKVKGLDLLCRAFARARTASAALILIGPDHRNQERVLRVLCDRLDIAQRTVFAGAALGPDKYDLLASADVYVHPSRSEGGMPFSVMEAAALGKPCLVTSVADPDGLLERYGGGIIVSPHRDSIADGIDRFMTMDRGEFRRMGDNARRMVEQEFAPEPIAAAVIDCYGTAPGNSHA